MVMIPGLQANFGNMIPGLNLSSGSNADYLTPQDKAIIDKVRMVVCRYRKWDLTRERSQRSTFKMGKVKRRQSMP